MTDLLPPETEPTDPAATAEGLDPAAATLLATAREQVLERGVGLSEQQSLACLQLPDDALPALLQLARW